MWILRNHLADMNSEGIHEILLQQDERKHRNNEEFLMTMNR